jgi:hypothetical protein
VLVDHQTVLAEEVSEGLHNIDTDAKVNEVDARAFAEVQRVNETGGFGLDLQQCWNISRCTS